MISVTATGGSPVIDELIHIDLFEVQPGDSGGTVMSASPFGVFHGIIKGNSTGDSFASKWSDIDQALDLQ